jgi:competence protein ComFC
MNVLDLIIRAVAPHNCLGCSTDEGLYCPACFNNLPAAPPFSHPLRYLSAVWSVTPYSGGARALIAQLKLMGTQAAAPVMAAGMAPFITDETFLLVPAPTSTGHARQRGYDQAKLLARHLSRLTGLPYIDCLRRLGQKHQTGASRHLRLKQMQRAFYVKNLRQIRDAKIMLIDDVVTTGATLESAAAVLLAAGAKEVYAITFAQA